jgi:hypothetical protein
VSDLDKAIRDAVANADVYRLRTALTAVLTACTDLEAIATPTSSERTAWVVQGQLANALGVEPDLTPRLVIDAPSVSSPDTAPAARPGDTVRLYLANGTEIVGRLYLDPEDDDRERVEDEHGCGWLVEVNGQRRRVEVVSPDTTGDHAGGGR